MVTLATYDFLTPFDLEPLGWRSKFQSQCGTAVTIDIVIIMKFNKSEFPTSKITLVMVSHNFLLPDIESSIWFL